jgi:hypothetical protein
MLPVVAVVAIVRRQAYDLWLTGVFLAATVVQLLARAFAHSGNHAGSIHPGELTRLYTVRVVDGAFLGSRLVHAFYSALSPSGAILFGLGVAGLLVIASLRQRRRRYSVYLFLLTIPIVMLAVTLILRSDMLGHLPNAGFVKGVPTPAGRYMIGPAVAVFLAALLCLQGSSLGSARPTSRALIEVSAGLLAVLLLINFPIDLYRTPYSSWTAQLRQQRTACATHNNVGTVRLYNAPGPPGWAAVMTCRQAFG